jgi:hypothetical protein
MPGLDHARLVLIVCSTPPAARPSGHRIGTGYFVAPNLVLTAAHVVPRSDSIAVRVEVGEPRWRRAGVVVWRDEKLDAALVRVDEALPSSTAQVDWVSTLPADNRNWTSVGYAEAAAVEATDGEERKSVGLDGTFYAQGGGGQGARDLDLGVNSAAVPGGWAGISGAPVFIDDQLAGIIKSVPVGFRGGRLSGVPAAALLETPGFRLALATPWLQPPSPGPWVLVLPSESDAPGELKKTVRSSLELHEDRVARAVGVPLPAENVIGEPLDEALASPERWLQFVERLCQAPIVVADVTGFDPAVMVALGVRAVVRRGVTVATTAKVLDESELSQLPFNIQEMKLISHGEGEADAYHPRSAITLIATTIAEGIADLRANPRYLDLPAYDAVRCPAPESTAEQRRARETVLVLCSFHKGYARHWQRLSYALAREYAKSKRTVVRMLDIASPRLAGAALYEHIRWAKTCVVDWTDWRANVFFELGVRLTCSNVEPLSLIEDAGLDTLGPQKAALLRLFGPVRYDLATLGPTLTAAVARHEAMAQGSSAPRPIAQVPLNATHLVATSAFDYSQERATARPHEILRTFAETNLGKDPQKVGDTPVLFSANPALSPELWRGAREQWIAAWLYLRHRFPEPDVEANAALQQELKRVGDSLLQWVRADPGDPFIGSLRREVFTLVRRWGPSASLDVLAQVRDLKTRAKNERDFDPPRYSEARALLLEATEFGRDEFDRLDRERDANAWKTLGSELADCYGLLGGVERRWAMQERPHSDERRQHLRDSVDAYDRGFVYEDDPALALQTTYNAVNRLTGRLLLDPGLLAPGALATGADGQRFALGPTLESVALKLEKLGRDDYWCQADLALIALLLQKKSVAAVYASFDAKHPPDFAYESAIAGLTPLIEVGVSVAPQLEQAREHLQQRLKALRA